MKLIDILARELDEWPEEWQCATQDIDGRVSGYCGPPSDVRYEDASGDWGSRKYLGGSREVLGRIEIAEDYTTAIITREQWEEARKAMKEYESLDWVDLGPGLADSVCAPPIDDPVNSPSHYTHGDIECIDAIEAQLTPEEFRGFCKGSVAKYVWRERHKGGSQSLQKAAWYLGKLTQADRWQTGSFKETAMDKRETEFQSLLRAIKSALLAPPAPKYSHYVAGDGMRAVPASRVENRPLMQVFDNQFESRTLRPYTIEEIREIEKLLAENGYLLSPNTYRPIDMQWMRRHA